MLNRTTARQLNEGEKDVCFLCLDPPDSGLPLFGYTVRLECCKQLIHKQCCFLLLLNGYNNCSICRNVVNKLKYFDENSLSIHYGMLNQKQQEVYYNEYQELRYNISNIECKASRVSMMLCSLRNRRKLLLLLVLVIYTITMVLLIQVNHHKEENKANNISLEYYAMINQ